MAQQVSGLVQGVPGVKFSAAQAMAAACTLLSELLGRHVTSRKIEPCCLTSGEQKNVACYESEDHAVVAICVCDKAISAYAGAALAMIPPMVAKESLAGGQGGDFLLENFSEILNIWRQLFQKLNPRILTPQLFLKREDVPPAVAALLSKPKSRADAEINIAGYGSGQISILIAV